MIGSIFKKITKGVSGSSELQEFAGKCIAELKKKIDELNTLNIIVMGKTGVGKSTLVNAVFGDELAKVGTGQPVTQNIRKFTAEGIPLAIYDTIGIELNLDTQEKALTQIQDVIEKGKNSNNINQEIHCIWYCVNTTSARFEDFESDLIKKIAKSSNVPIIIVMTQAVQYNKETGKGQKTRDLQKSIEAQNLPVKKVIPVMAQYDIDTETAAYGLSDLVILMENVLPEELKESFIHTEKAYLEPKIKKARAFVATAVASAVAACAIPVPFADSALLVPIQISMIASITVAFGLKMEKATMYVIISSALGTTGATIGGKAIVTGILKAIPGVGSVVGGAIAASTASVITATLDEAYIQLMILITNGEFNIKDISSKKGNQKIAELMKNAGKLNKISDEDIALLEKSE